MSLAKLRIVISGLLIAFVGAGALQQAPANGLWKEVIIRGSAEDIENIKSKIGVAILDARAGHYLLAVDAAHDDKLIERLTGNRAVASDNILLDVPRQGGRFRPSVQNSSTATLTTAGSGWTTYFGITAPRIYVEQSAVSKIGLPEAHQHATGRRTVVAVIDTGIDPNHPVLKDAVIAGKNYIVPSSNASEWNDPSVSQSLSRFANVDQNLSRFSNVDQSMSRFANVDQNLSRFANVDQSMSRFANVDQSMSRFANVDGISMLFADQSMSRFANVDGALPAAFGHGTMTAGLVHLAAPDALLMPMKAFDASGAGSLWNVVRAIHDSVEMGANVINMSFSGTADLRILEKAIEYASSRGVLVVASVGNGDSQVPTYPASFEAAMAVTALTMEDQKAGFSNYGAYVDMAGPGVDLVTTYPSNSYAIVSGTSFSTPLLAGVTGLLNERGVSGFSARQKIESTADPLFPISAYIGKLGRGRVNAAQAVR